MAAESQPPVVVLHLVAEGYRQAVVLEVENVAAVERVADWVDIVVVGVGGTVDCGIPVAVTLVVVAVVVAVVVGQDHYRLVHLIGPALKLGIVWVVVAFGMDFQEPGVGLENRKLLEAVETWAAPGACTQLKELSKQAVFGAMDAFVAPAVLVWRDLEPFAPSVDNLDFAAE